MDHLDGGNNDVSCRRQNLEPAKLPGCQVPKVPRTQPVLDVGSACWGKRKGKRYFYPFKEGEMSRLNR